MTQVSPARRWVSANFLAGYFEVTPKTIWAWAKAGKLPSPQKIGPNTTRWDLAEVESRPVQLELFD